LFGATFPGKLVQAPRLAGVGVVDAFVPDPIPRSVPLTTAMFSATTRAATAIALLEGRARGLPDPRVLIKSFVRREAQLSSYIENTYADFDEIAEVDGDPDARSVRAEARETLNAERAITHAIKAVFDEKRTIGSNLLCQLHSVLLQGVRGQEQAGRFRDRQVYIGNEREGIERARFVPPPALFVRDLMDDLDRFIREPGDLPELVQLALIHYQFETIHPFDDGNGRLGRILILLGLCQHRLLTTPVVNASLHFERNRQQYYDALLRVSTHGDWSGWIAFFLEGLRVASTESLDKLEELASLRRQYHDTLRSARSSSLLLVLIDKLFVSPVVTIPAATRILGVTYPAAKNSVQKLVEAGILSPIPDSSPTRFIARGILRALNPIPTRR
jgi:Fic family protein